MDQMEQDQHFLPSLLIFVYKCGTVIPVTRVASVTVNQNIPTEYFTLSVFR